eukprot:1629072-Prymnesium_polylepis.1
MERTSTCADPVERCKPRGASTARCCSHAAALPAPQGLVLGPRRNSAMGIPLPPPWVLMSLTFGLAGKIQDIKDIAGLGISIVTGRGEDAGCQLCDKLVSVVMKELEIDDMQDGGGVDCRS